MGFVCYKPALAFSIEAMNEAMPEDAAIRGMMFASINIALKQHGHEALSSKERVSFKFYPRRLFLEEVVQAASIISPDDLAQGLRLLGRPVYRTFRDTLIGRTLQAVADFNTYSITKQMPAGFRAGNRYGQATIHERRVGFLHLEFKDVWNYLHYSVGFLEGIALDNGETPRMTYVNFHRPGWFELKFEYDEKTSE